MYKVSEKLVEYHEDYKSNVSFKDNLQIISIPNWSSDHILCFGVLKFPDGVDNYDTHKFCRISMMEPKYIGAEGEDLILSKEDIDILMNILTSNNYRNYINTSWDYIIYHNNKEHDCDSDCDMECGWVPIPEDLPIPDYYKLLEVN